MTSNTFAQDHLNDARAIKRSIAALESELATHLAYLAAYAAQEVGTVRLDGGDKYVVREANTYDEGVMRAQLKPGQVARCSVTKLDKPTVKRLYRDVYDAAKKNNGLSVII